MQLRDKLLVGVIWLVMGGAAFFVLNGTAKAVRVALVLLEDGTEVAK